MVEKEAEFFLEELFFSRTDFKGIIKSGNSVFHRVSGFEWNELLNRPHNVIRHPNMPRGAFHYVWQELKLFNPIGAYVQNRSKDYGRYWVLALAVPVPDGYLSIRLKPSSGLLETISKLYEEVRYLESRLSPAESQEVLLQKVIDLGYSSYQEFMTEALIIELDSRQQKLTGRSVPELLLLKDLNEVNKSMCKIPARILETYKSIVWTPLNLEITALKLGDVGRAVGVVASTYQKMIKDLEKEIKLFEEVSLAVDKEIREATFLQAACYLISEIVDFFMNDKANEYIDTNHELKYLSDLKEVYESKVSETLDKVNRTLNDFSTICKTLRSLILSIEVIRVTGKVEISRLDTAHEFTAILNELNKFQKELADNMMVLQNSLRMSSDIVLKMLA